MTPPPPTKPQILDSIVTGHFVPRLFRTQVISCHFGHFIPIFDHFVPNNNHFVPRSFRSLFPYVKKAYIPYKNEKVAARLQLGCCYYAAINYVCDNWWRQSSQLELLVACLQQPCTFYQRQQAHTATTRSQLRLAAVTSKKTARTHS